MSYTINLRQRNQSTGTLSTTDISSYVSTGFSFVEKLDDSLDIGSLTLWGLEDGTPYDMFDTIEVLDGGTKLFSMRVAGDNIKLISKNPLRYEHTLSLVEHTKILERFVLSGKTFTQPTDGTIRYYLYDTVDYLLKTVPMETTTNFSTTRLAVLPTSGTLYDILTTTESPEFTFKDITLREALNQVFGYIDAIVRLKINSSDELEIDADFVNDIRTLITSENDFTEKTLQQDIELYGTDLESEALNLVNDALIGESVEIYPSDNTFTSARSDDYIFDFTKSKIPTPKPIYNISKLITRVKIEATYDGVSVFNDYQELDLNTFDDDNKNRVVEYNTYKTLEVSDLSTTEQYNPENYYQSNTIYYNFKEKGITHNNTVGIWGTTSAIDLLIRIKGYEFLIDEGHIADTVAFDDPLLNVIYPIIEDELIFQVHYTPIPDSMRLNIDRQDLSDVSYKSTIQANQQSRLVNLENFTNNMQGKINRIGNSELQLSTRESNYSLLPVIGDYTDDIFIATEKETIFYKDYVYCNLGFSKNYNMISKFIGVNSEIRQWEIGEKNTLDRNLVYKEYIEVDVLTSGSGSNSSQIFESDGIESFIDTLRTISTKEPVRGGMWLDDITSSPTTLVSLSSNGGGNSLIFNWKFEDNKSVGSYRETINAQTARNFASYTDEDGTNEDFTLYCFNKLDTGSTTEAQYLAIADAYPKSNITYIDTLLLSNDTRFKIYKDPREVIGGTIHFQMKSKDNSKVGLGRWFALRNRLVSENPPTEVRLYTYSNGYKFGRLNTLELPSGYDTESSYTATISVSYPNYNAQITDARLTSDKDSYCLTDENNKILLWVNQDGSRLDTITFDFLNKASGIKYKY